MTYEVRSNRFCLNCKTRIDLKSKIKQCDCPQSTTEENHGILLGYDVYKSVRLLEDGSFQGYVYLGSVKELGLKDV